MEALDHKIYTCWQKLKEAAEDVPDGKALDFLLEQLEQFHPNDLAQLICILDRKLDEITYSSQGKNTPPSSPHEFDRMIKTHSVQEEVDPEKPAIQSKPTITPDDQLLERWDKIKEDSQGIAKDIRLEYIKGRLEAFSPAEIYHLACLINLRKGHSPNTTMNETVVEDSAT